MTFAYDPAMTPSITTVSPSRGSSEGGTTVTITGTGFTAPTASYTITMGDAPCTVVSVTAATTLVCTTTKPAVKTGLERQVLVHTKDVGHAKGDATYQYVDLWSRQTTWGGGPLPVDGDSIVIPAETTVLLDVAAELMPKLHTIILFGNLRFDNSTSEIDLHLQVRCAPDSCDVSHA